ncbi:MAG: hypothetical protein RMM17_13035 [Acidobacteriota bacterium]|nr:hypothetical protein [Blastocatellia bacterium]MDW8413591.1 hypothetical protein [Acidobacteriota bacterium]
MRHKWLLPSLLAGICFVTTLDCGFVYDDLYHVVHATQALGDTSLTNLIRAVTTDIWTFSTSSHREDLQQSSVYYRPGQSLFLMLTFAYAGTKAWLWHLTSLLIHAIATCLVYFVILRSLRQNNIDNEASALVCASVFAVHPVQSESVAWIAASSTPLAAVFILLSLLAYLKVKEHKLWLAVSAASYAVAIFTKELAITLPLLLLGYELFILDKTPSTKAWFKRCVVYSLPFIAVTLTYLLIRYKIIGILLSVDATNPNFPDFPPMSRQMQLYTLPKVLFTYLKNLALPLWLSPFYPVYPIKQPDLLNFYLPLLVVVACLAILTIASLRSFEIRLATIWLLVPLVPALEIKAFKLEHLVFDRYLYLSVVGFGLLISYLARQLANKLNKSEASRTASLLSGVIASLLLAMAINQNFIWENEWTYWSAAYRAVPQSCVANIEMGRLSIDRGLRKEAITYLEQARTACPLSTAFNFQLAILYIENQEYEKAKAELLHLLKHAPNKATAAVYYDLALIYEIEGTLSSAKVFYEKAIEKSPDSEIASQAKQRLKLLQATADQRPKD